MQDFLATALLGEPKTAKQIALAIGKSESRTRELLKEFASEINCRKEQGKNVFWIGDGQAAAEPEAQPDPTTPEPEAPAAQADPIPAAVGDGDTCPLCHAEADQVQAGPEGTYLGAARRCSACSRTYNVHSNEEVIMAKEATTKTKRAPLNPQYKINARIKAAEAAGGKLKYEREGKTWVLTKKGMDPRRMTAAEFSNETAETITASLATPA